MPRKSNSTFVCLSGLILYGRSTEVRQVQDLRQVQSKFGEYYHTTCGILQVCYTLYQCDVLTHKHTEIVLSPL